ncbi:MAG: orotidine-5'-phosphate decarboxylase [Acidobacteria bacterium]|nr:orotidine-5'-phosphate decarboxylase [Acidobacteriota bacterium]
MSDSRIIVALDFASAAEAGKLVETLGDTVSFYKVGLELYTAAGMEFVQQLISQGKQVFLDLKLYDIGETVKRAAAVAAQSGVSFLTVHAVPQVMQAAVEGRGDSKLKILGVTVLTSLDDADLRADGHHLTAAELVELRVRNAVAAGVDGIVCSPLEIQRVRAITGPEMLVVTPGVRPADSGAGDQKRIATPAEALARGASHLVIGRPISRAADPRAAVAAVLAEISPLK